MSHKTFAHRPLAISLLASLTLASLAPAAYAGHGNGSWKKYRRYDCSPRVIERVTCAPSRVTIQRSSCGGSTLAGFVGGLALGVILSNAQTAYASPPPAYAPPPSYCPPPSPEYGYEDPYCHERYSSLEVCFQHERRCGSHPYVVRVIDVRDGDCVRVIHYDHGRWVDWDEEDWDD